MRDDSLDLNAGWDPERIGLILPTSLGGIVQSLPVLSALRERFSEASITAIVSREYAELIDGHPLVSGVIEYDRHGPLILWRKLMNQLLRPRFGMTVDFHGLLRTGIMARVTKAPVRIGLESAREVARFAYTRTLPDSGPLVPETQRFWRLAEHFGLGNHRGSAGITISHTDRNWVRARLDAFRRPLIAVHPGAGRDTKRWPIEKFAVAACKTIRRYGGVAIVLGSDAEQGTASQFAELMYKFIPARPVVNLAGSTSLKQLAAILEQSDCLLSNDSGPMHLAASLGTRVVSVFTCTSPLISGPSGPHHRPVSSCVACHASYRKRCPKRGSRHMACMEDVTTERVVNALRLVLDERINEIRRAA